MSEGEVIRKTVGTAGSPANPIRRAWELRNLLVKMGAKTPPNDEHVRRVVGRAEPKRG